MIKSREKVLDAVPVEVKVEMINLQIEELCLMCYQYGDDKGTEYWSPEIKKVRSSINELLSSIRKGVVECRSASKAEAAS